MLSVLHNRNEIVLRWGPECCDEMRMCIMLRSKVACVSAVADTCHKEHSVVFIYLSKFGHSSVLTAHHNRSICGGRMLEITLATLATSTVVPVVPPLVGVLLVLYLLATNMYIKSH